jgi:hypothetical protein
MNAKLVWRSLSCRRLVQAASVLRFVPFAFAAFASTLAATASGSALAQQKSVPDSLPPMFSGQSIHSTSPSSLLPSLSSNDPMRSWLSADANAPLSSASHITPRALKSAPNACKTESVLCYDYTRGQARLPIAKELMPEIPGLKKESLSVKRDRLSMNYSF